jgi:hypothetical protein
MADISEIREWVDYQVTDRHSKRLKELAIDRKFFLDNYDMPLIKDAKYRVRTGYVAGMMNNITQQLISNKPRVFTIPRTSPKESASKRIASLGNKQLQSLSRYPDNPLDATFKRNFMGEAWIYIPHISEIAKWQGDEDWRDVYPNVIPCHFILYDSTVVFSEPSEEVNGIPSRVGVQFERFISDIKSNYPKWVGKGDYKNNSKVKFTLYFEKDFSYAEADEEPLFRNQEGDLVNIDGRRDNLYGFVPFVHSYSGWGYENETKDPDLLAFSRVRMIRDKIVTSSTIASNIEKNITEHAWKHRVMVVPQTGDFDADNALSGYNPSEPDSVSIIKSPNGTKPEIEETKVFDTPIFGYWNMLRADLDNEFPQVLQGNDLGSSGRNLDIAGYLGLSLYDCCLNNTAQLWAKALDLAFKICDKLDIQPRGMEQGDSNSYSELTVDLKKEAPSELSRKNADAMAAYQAKTIDLKTYLIEGRNKTDEEADKIIAAMLAFNAMSNHPFFMDLMAQQVAESQRLRDKFEQYKQMAGQTTANINPSINFGARGGEPRQGNIQSLQGAETSMPHETRLAPIRR